MPADTATGRPLLDLLAVDKSLGADALRRIAAFADRVLTPGDLAAMLAYRIEMISKLGQEGEIGADRILGAWEKIGVFAVAVVQAQAGQSGTGGASVTIEWGGFRAPPPPAGRVARRSDPQVGDIVDAE